MSTEPASAVPSDAPMLVAVFCRPPTSGLCSSGTAETVTPPSCEASAPMPRPSSSSGTVTTSADGPTSMAARSTTVPGEHRESAEPHDPARVGVRAEARDPGCREQQRDRERQQPHAGVDRRETERDRQEQRHDEEDGRTARSTGRRTCAARRAAGRSAASPGARGARRRAPRAAPPTRRRARAGRAPARISHSIAETPNSRARPAWARPSPTRSIAGRRRRRGPGRPPTARCRRGRCAGARRAARRRSGASARGSPSTISTSPANTQRQLR